MKSKFIWSGESETEKNKNLKYKKRYDKKTGNLKLETGNEVIAHGYLSVVIEGKLEFLVVPIWSDNKDKATEVTKFIKRKGLIYLAMM